MGLFTQTKVIVIHMLQKNKATKQAILVRKTTRRQCHPFIVADCEYSMRVLQFQHLGTLCKHPLSSRVQYRNHNFIKTTRFTSVGVGNTCSTKQQKATWTKYIDIWKCDIYTHEIVFQLYYVTLSTLFFNPSQYVSSQQVEQSPEQYHQRSCGKDYLGNSH